MSENPKSVRFSKGALALIAAEMDRTGQAFGAVVESCVVAQLGGFQEEAAAAPQKPAPKSGGAQAQAPRKPAAEAPAGVAKLAKAREALAEAEARTGAGGKGRMAVAMERAGVMVWNGEKRPTYQKGQAGRGKRAR